MDGLKLVPIEYGDQHALQRQALFLYDLLLERDPVANISHKSNPPFWKHLEFINSKPYAVWNIIEWAMLGPESAGDFTWVPIGSVYLTRQDEIGLFLKNDYQGKGFGREAIRMFTDANPRKAYYANIAPGNEASQRFFTDLGFRHIQNTYRMEPECAG